MSTAAEWDAQPYFRVDWERERREATAQTYDLIADTEPDEKKATFFRWQALLYRWNAEHTR
jgi:hypothetical protein